MKPNPKADQVGSLTRPAELRKARQAFRAGQMSRQQLTEFEDQLILDVLGRQHDIGLDVLTDGELRRDAWQTDIVYAFEGFSPEWPTSRRTLADGSSVELELHTKPLVGRLRQTRRITEHETGFLLQHAPGPVKVTMPSPHVTAWGSYKPGVSDQAYESREAIFADLVPAYQREMKALAEEGVAYIQLDEGFTRYGSPLTRASMTAGGEDLQAALDRDIEVENACYRAVAGTEVILATHLCRGSRTADRATGDYEWMAERVLNELDVDRFLWEYDSDAVGGFEPLRFLPKGKTVVLGLVTSKEPGLESQEALMAKIEEAARYCPVEQLALSPQCGFGGSADNDFMSVEQQWRKLENLVAVARRVWG